MDRFQTFLFRWRGGLMAVVAVVVLALGRPTPGSLMLGVLLGIAGESLRFWSIGYSRGHTRGLTVEGPFLATGGPYAYTRNPLYLGNVLNSLGVAIASIGDCHGITLWLIVGLTVSSLSVVYGGIIPLEQRYLASVHGELYQRYCREVPSFLPSLRPQGPRQGEFCLDSALYFERWTLTWWTLIWALLTFRSF